MRAETNVDSPYSKFKEDNRALLLYKGKGDDKAWSLYAWGSQLMRQGSPVDSESFLTHACALSDAVSEVYVFPDIHSTCWWCQGPIPDGIKALWIMHNGVI